MSTTDLPKIFRTCRECKQRYRVAGIHSAPDFAYRCDSCAEEKARAGADAETNRARLAQARGKDVPSWMTEPPQMAKVRAVYDETIREAHDCGFDHPSARRNFLEGKANGLALAFEFLTGRSLV